jgi:predicted permease
MADVLTLAGETSVRWALGATSWRLAGELGAMSALWCLIATTAAWVIAAAIQVPVAAYAQAHIPRLNQLRLDGSVALLAIGIALTLACAISLLPMLYARKAGSARSVHGTAAPTGMPRWRRVFVVVQLAVAVVVLSTAALLFRSASSLSRVDPGFVADGVNVFEMMLPPSRYATPPSRVAFQRRLLDAVADLPAARAAAVVDYVPFGGSASIVNFTVENYVASNAMAKPRASLLAVSGGYFDALSIPQLDGRRFVTSDEADGATAVVVNDAFVHRYIADGRVLGRRVKRGEPDSKNPWMSIVGVVGSVRGAGLTMEPQPEVFIPYVRGGARGVTNLVVNAGTPTAILAPAVLERIHRVDGALSPTDVTTMRALLERAVGQPTFYARLFAVLALVACVLSLTGVYGVAVLGVSARSNEIAIRSCLGAQRSDIIALVMRETAVSVGFAVAAGTVGAWMLQRRIAALVYGAESSDWLMIALSAVALSLLAFAAVHTAVRKIIVLRPLDLLRHGAGALA